MRRRSTTAERRQGAALVEMAFVALVFLMLLFGILEYCRFLFFKQIMDNAAREGARYAVVNTASSTVTADTLARVSTVMAGMDKNLKNYSAQVYAADAAGTNLGTPDTAAFGTYIAVELSADYSPILPSFLLMNSTIKLSSKALMYSEAN
ncbi:MAG: TadE/TadG family type IV pilus assembly protein [Gemmataceae bacterium]